MNRHTLAILALSLALAGAAQAQRVIRPADPAAPLEARWTWAQQQARQEGDAWIGYSIRRRMEEYSTIRHGSYHVDWSGHASLAEVLSGQAAPAAATSREDVQRAAQQALDRRSRSPRMVEKDVAILFRTGRGGRSDEIEITNVSEPFELGTRPLLWLGGAGDEESLALLEAQYERAGGGDFKEGLVAAVGIHDLPARVVPFLAGVLRSGEDSDLREQAAFWLGQTDDPKALDLLKAAVRDDRSRDLREHAVFAISQMDLEAATDELIRLARRSEDRQVQEKAIFWLGQQASEKAVEAIKDAVFDEGHTEVQKQAVFALSQLPTETGLPMLIDVARTHRNPEVRKQAIFWLGQSGDPRAVDFLVELVQGR